MLWLLQDGPWARQCSVGLFNWSSEIWVQKSAKSGIKGHGPELMWVLQEVVPNFGGHKHQFSWHRSMEAALSWPSFQERQRPRPDFSWDIKCGHVPVEGLVVTLPLNQKQNEDNDKGFWAVFLLKLVPFPQPPSLIKEKKPSHTGGALFGHEQA